MQKKSECYQVWQSPQLPDSLVYWGEKYLRWMEMNYSLSSINKRAYHLSLFLSWCVPRDFLYPNQITTAILETYQSYLSKRTNYQTKKPLTAKVRNGHICSVNLFFHWLVRKNLILSNPAEKLVLAQQPRRLPREILSARQAEYIINLPNVDTLLGVRDRAMLEILYSSGIRGGELINLNVSDVDLQYGTLLIIEGKGSKDRLIPLGDRAARWIEKYIAQVRPWYEKERERDTLFLTSFGKPFTIKGISHHIGKYVRQANFGKRGACHLFRHAMATQMLANGADIRYIQEILGHDKLSTTQIYTKVSISKLKEIHATTHPAERKVEQKEIEVHD